MSAKLLQYMLLQQQTNNKKYSMCYFFGRFFNFVAKLIKYFFTSCIRLCVNILKSFGAVLNISSQRCKCIDNRLLSLQLSIINPSNSDDDDDDFNLSY